eukprot:s2117_g3.t1
MAAQFEAPEQELEELSAGEAETQQPGHGTCHACGKSFPAADLTGRWRKKLCKGCSCTEHCLWTLKFNTKCISQAHVDSLLRLQEQHLQAFKGCYGTCQVKPKHHYGFHTSQPAMPLQIFMDCFVCERKNKNFKSLLRGKDCPRDDFEVTALASLLSNDRPCSACARLPHACGWAVAVAARMC